MRLLRFGIWLGSLLLAIGLVGVVVGPLFGGGECDNLPRFTILVAGQPLGSKHASSNGTFCGAIGDGAGFGSLEPVHMPPRAKVSLDYETWYRWPYMAYTIRQGDAVIRQGRLTWARTSFSFPEQPGRYEVAIEVSSSYARMRSYFPVVIAQPEGA